MSIFQAIILGIIQGVAEFLPISSSGHMLLFEQAFGITFDPAVMTAVTVLMHVGTLAAVIIVLWKDWLDILKNLFHSKTLLLLIIASVPALIFKLILGDAFDRINAGGFLGLFFLVTACLMVLVERFGHGKHNQRSARVEYRHAVSMGCCQCLGLMTGISRSGSSILGGVASGLPRYMAVKFSFMMSAPAVLGSLLMEGRDLMRNDQAASMLGSLALPLLAGMIVSFAVGLLTMRWMLRLVNRISFYWFAVYMGFIGVLTIVLQAIGVGSLMPLFSMGAA